MSNFFGTYDEMIINYRKQCLQYPPHKSLTESKQVALRKLHSYTFIFLNHLALIHAGLYSTQCTLRGAPRVDIHHIFHIWFELQPLSAWELTELES